MRLRGIACSLLVAAVAGVGAAGAQSLAEIAKKEQERQKATKPTGKRYTDKDLANYPPRPVAGDAATKSGDAPAGKPDVPAIDAPEPAGQEAPPAAEKGETYWKGLIKAAQDKIEQDRASLDALQKQASRLETDWVDRDDYAVRALIWEQRSKVLAEIERVKKEIDAGQKEVEKIRDDARRQGVPPGWLR